MNTVNRLWPEDEILFNLMRGHYFSAKEQKFFEEQEHKQRSVLTVSNDLVMSERNNKDHLYIVRCWYEEYIVGSDSGELHFMCLSDALSANLKDCGILDKNITLLQWLRDRDYSNVEYNHNFDNL